jgi:hypothetical protein
LSEFFPPSEKKNLDLDPQREKQEKSFFASASWLRFFAPLLLRSHETKQEKSFFASAPLEEVERSFFASAPLEEVERSFFASAPLEEVERSFFASAPAPLEGENKKKLRGGALLRSAPKGKKKLTRRV